MGKDVPETLSSPGSSTSQKPRLAAAALVLMALFWGYNWVVMKNALRFADASAFASLRVLLSAAGLFLVLAVLRRPIKPTDIRLTAAVGLLGVSGSMGLSIWALDNGGVGKTAVLVYTMPVWVLLMSRVVLREKLRGLQWLSVASALVGLCFVLAPWSMGGSALGNVLGVASGICWGAATVAAKVLSGRRQVDVLSLTAWQMLFGAVPLVVLALLTSDSAPLWTRSFIAALVYNVVFSTIVALALWFYALRTLTAGTAGLASLGAPVVGVVSAWLQLGEQPHPFEAAGIVLILAALGSLTARQAAADRSRSARG